MDDLNIYETLPGRHEEYMGFVVWWTGWKQRPNDMTLCGQWVAMDYKTQKGYYYNLPGHKFAECNPTTTFDPHLYAKTGRGILIDMLFKSSVRNKMIRQGRRSFKRLINEAERAKVLKALDDKPEKEKEFGFSPWNPQSQQIQWAQKAQQAQWAQMAQQAQQAQQIQWAQKANVLMSEYQQWHNQAVQNNVVSDIHPAWQVSPPSFLEDKINELLGPEKKIS